MPADSKTPHDLHAARLASAQRYELVGQIAAPVTHEINNALAVIVMYADLLRSQFDEGTEVREDLDEVFSAAQRAAWMSKWLNGYAGRGERRDTTPVSLSDVLERARKIFAKYVQSLGMEIEFDLSETPPIAAPADEVQDLVLALMADLIWCSTQECRLRVSLRVEGSRVVYLTSTEGSLSPIGELDDFTFLAPGPGDAGGVASTRPLRARVEAIGGRLVREHETAALRYRLELPAVAVE